MTLIDRLMLLHLVLSGLWLHLVHILLLTRILGLVHYVILLIHLLGAIVVLLVLRHRLSMSLNLLVSLVESIDVEIGEVGRRLIQIVVQRAVETTSDSGATHVLELLRELFVCDDLLGARARVCVETSAFLSN